MVKDRRYKTIKNLIESGHISLFSEIFDTLPKSVLYKDLGINNTRFNNLLGKVEQFLLNDIFRIADLIETSRENVLKLILNQYEFDLKDQKKSTKKKTQGSPKRTK